MAASDFFLGAGLGIGGLLSQEFENINQEKRDARKLERTKAAELEMFKAKLPIEAEWAEKAAIRAEERAAIAERRRALLKEEMDERAKGREIEDIETNRDPALVRRQFEHFIDHKNRGIIAETAGERAEEVARRSTEGRRSAMGGTTGQSLTTAQSQKAVLEVMSSFLGADVPSYRKDEDDDFRPKSVLKHAASDPDEALSRLIKEPETAQRDFVASTSLAVFDAIKHAIPKSDSAQVEKLGESLSNGVSELATAHLSAITRMASEGTPMSLEEVEEAVVGSLKEDAPSLFPDIPATTRALVVRRLWSSYEPLYRNALERSKDRTER